MRTPSEGQTWMVIAILLIIGLGPSCGNGTRSMPEEGAQVVEDEPGAWERFVQHILPSLDDCAELSEWLVHHQEGFERVVEHDGLRLSLRRVPAICAVCQDVDWSSSFNDTTLLAALSARRSTDSYVLTVKETADRPKRQPMDTALFSDLHSDACGARWLEVVGRDTIPCAFAHVEATGEMFSGSIILLAFEHQEDLDTRTVLLMPKQGDTRPEIVFKFKETAFHELDERLVLNARYRMNNTKGG